MANTLPPSSAEKPSPPSSAEKPVESHKERHEELANRNLWERWLRTVQHTGPRNCLIRGFCEVGHALLSLVLAVAGADTPHAVCNAICHVLGSGSLVVQFRSSNQYMFLVRVLLYWIRSAILVHGAICDRSWLGEECEDGWNDARKPLKVLACIEAVRLFLYGTSLLVQYIAPEQGLGQHGNTQLLVRGWVHAAGILIQYSSAMMKLGELTGTMWQREVIEILVHFARAFCLVPLATWALMDQWASCGSGKPTDDRRTSEKGDAHRNHANNLMHKVSPHKGHRNLLIRCCCTLGMASVTAWQLVYDKKVPVNSLKLLAQLVSALSLFIQWMTGNPKMFLLRAGANWFTCAVVTHTIWCGPNWPGDVCASKHWDDIRSASTRIVTIFSATRLFANGSSLILQFNFPARMFRGHGNQQLFIRGCIQGTGSLLHITLFLIKVLTLTDTQWEQHALDYTANVLRGCVFIPISSMSLIHQWYHTGPGNTGHPASDLHERTYNKGLADPEERVRVTIISAKGIRSADVGGRSDPYVICSVPARPTSTFQTQFILKTLEPVWNESQELPLYTFHDSIEFTIRDHDEAITVPCFKFFDDGDDLLGKALLTSAELHPDGVSRGFEGEVHLDHAGRRHKDAVLVVKVEFLQGQLLKDAAQEGAVSKAEEVVGKEVLAEVAKVDGALDMVKLEIAGVLCEHQPAPSSTEVIL